MILAGFAADIALVLAALPPGTECFTVDENTPDGFELPESEIAVYVFSPDTGYSSHLLTWFTWIHHHVAPAREYVVGVRELDPKRTLFDFVKDWPVLSVDELRFKLGLLVPHPGPGAPGGR